MARIPPWNTKAKTGVEKMTITFQGKPITLKGTLLHTGDTMPEFTLTDNALNPVHSRDLD